MKHYEAPLSFVHCFYVIDFLNATISKEKTKRTATNPHKKIHENITYTAECNLYNEYNNSITFLDFSITKFEQRHKFSIYRNVS